MSTSLPSSSIPASEDTTLPSKSQPANWSPPATKTPYSEVKAPTPSVQVFEGDGIEIPFLYRVWVVSVRENNKLCGYVERSRVYPHNMHTNCGSRSNTDGAGKFTKEEAQLIFENWNVHSWTIELIPL